MSGTGRLAGRVALVTGAANGIGAAIAARLAREGAAVALADLDEAGARAGAEAIAKAGGRALALRADVASDADARRCVEQTVARLGGLHVLVNNAGINVMKTVESATDADFARCLDVDLKGVWLFARHALPPLRAAGGGAIVNIASTHAFRTVPGTFPYSAAKGAVISFTQELALEVARDRIRVNAICPGTIETRGTRDWFAAQPDPDAVRRRFLAAIPLGRIGTPEDVAALAAFLASDDAAFLTGTAISLDGGRGALSAAGTAG